MRDKPFKLFIHAVTDPETGQSAMGIMILTPEGKVEARISKHIGRANELQAGFKAFLGALQEIRRRNISRAVIYTHDEHLLRMAKGIYQVMDPIVKQLKKAAREEFRGLHYDMELIDPGKNQEAVSLARQGLSEFVKSQNHSSGIIRMSQMEPQIQPAPGVRAVQAEQHSAGGVVYRRDGQHYKICLIAKKHKSVWALPKGRVDPGETPEETAIREVGEETGHLARIQTLLDQIQYFFYWKENNTFYHKYVYFFLMPLAEENKFNRDQEADAVRWVTPGEAYRMVTYLNEKEIIRKAMMFFNANG